MSLDVRDLELLDALANDPNLMRASERLFVSQPALSQRLAKIEQRIGAPIFERRGRRLVPNDVGLQLLPSAVRILGDLRSAEHHARELARLGRDRLRLATQCSTTFAWITPVMRELREVHPSAVLAIETLPCDGLFDALLGSQIDVAIVNELDPRTDRLRVQHLFDDEMVAVVWPDHPWALQPHVAPDDFTDAHVILHDTGDPWSAPSLPLGANPAHLTTMPLLTDLIVELVASRDGVSILPAWIARPYVERGQVVAVPLGPRPTPRSWYAAIRHDDARPTVLDLVDLLHAHFHPVPADSERRPA
jgi:LysR family transcriptional regulator for metE and metH